MIWLRGIVLRDNFYLYVYGSLLNPRSAFKVLGRSVQEYKHVRLPGAILRWSSLQRVRLLNEDCEFNACSLNIEFTKDLDVGAYGGLIEVFPEELGRLLIRENGYSLINITWHDFECLKGKVYTFQDLRPSPSNCVVMQGYYDRVIDGAREQGKNFFKSYFSTLSRPASLIEGDFVFADQAHQNLV